MRFLVLFFALLLAPAQAGETIPQAEQPGESTFTLHDLQYHGDEQVLHSSGMAEETDVEISAACCKVCKKGQGVRG